MGSSSRVFIDLIPSATSFISEFLRTRLWTEQLEQTEQMAALRRKLTKKSAAETNSGKVLAFDHKPNQGRQRGPGGGGGAKVRAREYVAVAR